MPVPLGIWMWGGGGSFTADYRPAADLNEPPFLSTDGSDRWDWTDRQQPTASDGERSGVSSDASNARDAGDVDRGVGAAHLPRIFCSAADKRATLAQHGQISLTGAHQSKGRWS